MADAYGFTKEGMARAVKNLRALERQIKGMQNRQYLNQERPSELWYPFKNSTGETVPRSGVFRITGLTVDNDGGVIFTTEKASTTFGRVYAINSPEPIPDGQYGVCFIGSIPMEVAYDPSGTPANGETWGPKPGEWVTFKNYPGFTVEGIVDSTNHIMLATREEPQTYIGKADSAIAVGASGTVSVYIGTPGSETDSTVNISSCHNRTSAIASGAWVTVTFINGHPYVAGLECEE